MLAQINAHSPRFKFFLLIPLLLIAGTVIFAAWNTPVEIQEQSSNRLEAEIVTVTPTGFEPGEITRPKGRFILAVDNRSGLDEVDLYFVRETGARLNSRLTRKGKLAWREIVDFPTGTYILKAANDESWSCRITLTPQ